LIILVVRITVRPSQ